VPGYAAPEEGPTTEAARRAMVALKSVAYDARRAGVLGRPRLTGVDPALVAELSGVVQGGGVPVAGGDPDLPPETVQALLHAWAALHGFVSLEAFGHLTMHREPARSALFIALVRTISETIGLPVPRSGWPPT
jgi:hypothetical protein